MDELLFKIFGRLTKEILKFVLFNDEVVNVLKKVLKAPSYIIHSIFIENSELLLNKEG